MSTQPGARLAPETYACLHSGYVILLSLQTNEYIALEPEDGEALGGRVAGWPRKAPSDGVPKSKPHDALLATLVRRGFVTETAVEGESTVAGISFDPRTLTDEPRVDPTAIVRLSDVVVFAWSYVFVRCSLKVGGMWLVRRLTRQAPLPNQPGNVVRSGKLKRLLNSFERLRPWFYSAKDHCLLDSLVMIEYLSCRSIRSTLFIGVKTGPFEAHAWTALGNGVLNDDADTIRKFTPILKTPA